MRITYYALRDVPVGNDIRVAGDLVPEAAQWPFLPGYIRDGIVAPVLVATLPAEVQAVLSEWESDQQATGQTGTPSAEDSTTTTGDQPAAKQTKQKEKVA